jgi:hypothetical protein
VVCGGSRRLGRRKKQYSWAPCKDAFLQFVF